MGCPTKDQIVSCYLTKIRDILNDLDNNMSPEGLLPPQFDHLETALGRLSHYLRITLEETDIKTLNLSFDDTATLQLWLTMQPKEFVESVRGVR
jgi:hypothetical protein